MSLTATLAIMTSVLVKELRPALFTSFAFFQMHAITDTLLATEMNTQMDNNAIQNSSNKDIDDDMSMMSC